MIQHKAKKWGVEQVAEERDLLEEFLVTIERCAKDDITENLQRKPTCFNRGMNLVDNFAKIFGSLK